MNIILCEPQCVGFEHAAFNAALLVTASAAFPYDKITFFCEVTHRQEIEKVVTQAQLRLPSVVWREAQIPPSHTQGLRRLNAESALVQNVLFHAGSTPGMDATRGVLFCSTTEITILALKQQLRKIDARMSVAVVLHGILASLRETRWCKPWRWGFSLRQALHWPSSHALKYVVLSPGIRECAVQTLPALSNSLHGLHMPRLWNPTTDAPRTAPAADLVRFTYFGRTVKGFSQFYNVAQAVKTRYNTAQFSLAGFLNGRDLECAYDENIVSDLARAPISQEEYSRLALRADYAVWLADPAHYALTASATFVDALDYCKPLVYLANPYIDFYFNKMGDIGYRCETLSQMQTVIENLARDFPATRYRKQRAAMRAGRTRFEPQAIAPDLNTILQ